VTGYSNVFAYTGDAPLTCPACRQPIASGTPARWQYGRNPDTKRDLPRRMIHDVCSPAPPIPIENDPTRR
jgi:hypothetical protein